MKEEGEGKLPEAIEIFNSIVEDSNADEALQAKALLHVGLCYEKLGKQEATKAYQKLVNNFPGQKNEVAIARERLSRLILVETTPQIMTDKKIWEDTDIDDSGEISPDGKFIAYCDWKTGNLAIYEIETGFKKYLSDLNPGQGSNFNHFAFSPRWSADSRYIYYSVFVNPNLWEARLSDLSGRNIKTLCKVEGKEIWLELNDVAKKGNFVLTTIQSGNNKTQIAIISANNGKIQILKEFPFTGYVEHLNFTSNESAIIYDYPSDLESANRDINILSIDEKIDKPLIQHSANDFILGFYPESGNLLFASNRSGNLGFWSVKLDNDKIAGIPKFIKTSEHEYLKGLGFTKTGAFVYCHFPSKTDVYETEISPEEFKVVEPPYEKVGYFVSSNSTPDYSPDGKYLAFVSRRFPYKELSSNCPTGNILCIKSLKDDNVREIRPDISNFGFLQWTQDSRFIIAVNWGADQKMGLYKIDVTNGNISLVMKGDFNTIHNHQVCPNGNLIVVKSSNNEGQLNLVEYSLVTGNERVLYSASWKELYNISCSPDGNWIAFIGKDKIRTVRVIPSKGGKVRDIYTFEQGDNRGVLFCWSANSKGIYLPMLNEPKKDLIWDIWRIPIDGSNPKKLGLNLTFLWQLRVHPDGKHLIFSNEGTSYKKPEVWMMENFLPF